MKRVTAKRVLALMLALCMVLQPVTVVHATETSSEERTTISSTGEILVPANTTKYCSIETAQGSVYAVVTKTGISSDYTGEISLNSMTIGSYSVSVFPLNEGQTVQVEFQNTVNHDMTVSVVDLASFPKRH